MVQYLREEVGRRRKGIRVRKRDDRPDYHLRVLPLLECELDAKVFTDNL